MSVQENKSGEVVFICNAPLAKRVYLAGTFNSWDATARRMVKTPDGSFRAKLKLKPGTYEYRFVIDGSWTSDPGAPACAKNPYGSENSVAQIG